MESSNSINVFSSRLQSDLKYCRSGSRLFFRKKIFKRKQEQKNITKCLLAQKMEVIEFQYRIIQPPKNMQLLLSDHFYQKSKTKNKIDFGCLKTSLHIMFESYVRQHFHIFIWNFHSILRGAKQVLKFMRDTYCRKARKETRPLRQGVESNFEPNVKRVQIQFSIRLN